MSQQTPAQLTESIKSKAITAGFSLCGVAPAVSPTGFHRLVDWIRQDFHGEMKYIPNRLDAYQNPDSVLQNVKSVVMLGMDYCTVAPKPTPPDQGRVARYAWGNVDYHDLIRQRLRNLESDLLREQPGLKLRTAVDTAPLLEREFAQLAGLGWFGKNTMLISRTRGSYFFLAALLIDVELVFDQALEFNHCGTCSACLDACPTQAFPSPGVLDATKCISYLTIEHRSPIASEHRTKIADWLFGCDVCQEVCPWNRFSQPTEIDGFFPKEDLVDLPDLFELSDDQFRMRFRKSPLWRAKRRGLLRNAAIVLGNNPGPNAIEALSSGIRDDEALVRGASAWALGQIGGPLVEPLLKDRLKQETDEEVRIEVKTALDIISRRDLQTDVIRSAANKKSGPGT